MSSKYFFEQPKKKVSIYVNCNNFSSCTLYPSIIFQNNFRSDLKFLKPVSGASSALQEEIRNSSSNSPTVLRNGKGATIDGSKKLFEPHFLNKQHHRDDDDLHDENNPSRKSVISNWDDYVLKEDLEEEEEQEERDQFDNPLSPARRGPLTDDGETRHPYLLTESPFTESAALSASPSPKRKVRTTVMQLQSEAEALRQQQEAERKAAVQPTYAERLLNITADDKLKELLEDEDQMQLCQNGSGLMIARPVEEEEEETEEKENLVQNGSDQLAGSKVTEEEEDPGEEDGIVRDENGEIKTVWKLPPEPEKKPNKKKKRKPKAST